MMRYGLCLGLATIIIGLGSGPVRANFVYWQKLMGVTQSDAQWGDIDNDGDLDLALCGMNWDSGDIYTIIYENHSGTLAPRQSLEGIYNSSSGCLAWGDYDGDGDLDLAMAGLTEAGDRIARVYRNYGGGDLTWDQAQVLMPVKNASVAWGDCDKDGDLDLFLQGDTGTASVGILYENDPLGSLSFKSALPTLSAGSCDWGDYDNDGDFDLIQTGSIAGAGWTILMTNDPPGSLLSGSSNGLPDVRLSDVATGDFDNDGDLDVAITGELGFGAETFARVFENDGTGNFTQYWRIGNPELYRSSCAWGDYDNDGDLDVAFCGYNRAHVFTRVYSNTGTSFYPMDFGFRWVADGSLSWADVDQDGDLDLLVTGNDNDSSYAIVYRNTAATANTPPSAPTYSIAGWNSGKLAIGWTGAADGQTPASGLTYCLRVGTTAGAHDLVSGTYGSPLMGNYESASGAAVVVLDVPHVDYYWSVCAIDAGFMRSGWIQEKVCEVPCNCVDSGDLNLDGNINPLDVVFIVNYVYRQRDDREQIPNCPTDNGDWNCDTEVNPVDVVLYVNYVYKAIGSGPCNPCAP